MATQTTNLKLVKPDKTDFYNVDDFNGNMDIIDNEIQRLKPVVKGIEGEWKRATVIIPDLQFEYYAGSQYVPKQTSALIVLNDYISDDIKEAVVVSVCPQYHSYMVGYAVHDIGVRYCAIMPDGKCNITLYDKAITEADIKEFIVMDILYK